jgi:hypothetical protein
VHDLLGKIGFTADIQTQGEEALALKQQAGYKVRQRVVEHAHSWINRLQRLLIQWVRKVEDYRTTLHFAYA